MWSISIFVDSVKIIEPFYVLFVHAIPYGGNVNIMIEIFIQFEDVNTNSAKWEIWSVVTCSPKQKQLHLTWMPNSDRHIAYGRHILEKRTSSGYCFWRTAKHSSYDLSNKIISSINYFRKFEPSFYKFKSAMKISNFDECHILVLVHV